MREPMEPKLPKWPFFLGDALLLGAAWFISFQSKPPMGPWQILFVVLCVAGGACLGIMPFLLEYRITVKLVEASALTTVVSRMQNLETIAAQISVATAHWQAAQDQAEKTAGDAKAIADRMTAEIQSFSGFMERANESEKATLRLEVEKLHRSENEWVQVVVRTLDHVFALHLGAVRSGQPTLIAQLTNFQTACRDAARRVGLSPFIATHSEPFDPLRHQLIEGDAKTVGDAVVAETVAAGYTFQGRLLRPALVRLREGNALEPIRPQAAPTPLATDDQNQLQLEDKSAA
jgi:molecular chaperone GrpE (heat shock protein)